MIESCARASDLPADWDSLAGDNYALKRAFLTCLEIGNTSVRHYYLFRKPDGSADSLLVASVVRGFNVLQFTPFTFRIGATFMHAPLSITRPGCVLGNIGVRSSHFTLIRF